MANFNYVTNFNTLDTIGNILSEVKSNYGREFEIFERLLHGDPENLDGVCNSIVEDARKINTALVGLNSAYNVYKEAIETLEKNLLEFNVEGVEAPTEFIGGGELGGFSKNIDPVVIPLLSGEASDNKELGYYGNQRLAEDFYNRYSKNDRIGQCVSGFTDFLDYVGIHDDLVDQGLHVYWAQEYYTNEHNREILSEYFDIVPITNQNDLRDGDWLIFTKESNYSHNSHVGMYYDGKLFGRNQVNSNLGDGNVFTLNNADFSDLGEEIYVYRLKPGVGNG